MENSIKLEEAQKIASLMPALMRQLFTLDDEFSNDLPLAQLRVCTILRKGPRQMTALSRELGISLSALTQISDRLERSKLVERVTDLNDRRIRCLQLTANAEKMMVLHENSRIQNILAVLNSMSPGAAKILLTHWRRSCMQAWRSKMIMLPMGNVLAVCITSGTICHFKR